MANVCSYGLTMRGRQEDAERVWAILRDEDPEYTFTRWWPDDICLHRLEDGVLALDGGLPWTADYLWCPENTLHYGGIVPGITKCADSGRTFVSIPWLCRTFGMTAEGWEEECGCDVNGEYACGPDGVMTYTPTPADGGE